MIQLKKSSANIAYLVGSVIDAVMALAIFVDGANAGDCPGSKSAETISKEANQIADEKTEVEA